MADVVELSEVLTEPVAEVVEALQELLADAESGNLRGFALAGHTQGDCTMSFMVNGDGDVAHLVCALERTKLRLLGFEDGD